MGWYEREEGLVDSIALGEDRRPGACVRARVQGINGSKDNLQVEAAEDNRLEDRIVVDHRRNIGSLTLRSSAMMSVRLSSLFCSKS